MQLNICGHQKKRKVQIHAEIVHWNKQNEKLSNHNIDILINISNLSI